MSDTRVQQGIFGFSFFSWQGNNVDFSAAPWLNILLVVSTFLILIILVLIRKNITSFYNGHKKQVLIFFQFYGSFIIFLTIFRIIILAIGNYPNLWELIPFHFCRMFIIIMSIILLFRKIEWIKYIGFFAICGGIVGLLITDLHSNEYWDSKGGIRIGYDSYSYWDFYIIHISSVTMAQYIIMVNRFKLSKSNVLVSSLFLISLSFALFILNWSFSFLDDYKWQSNWFYFAPDSVNGIDDTLSKFLGPIAKWPTIFFLFILIGIFLYTISLVLYFWIDSLDIDFKRKPKIIKVQSTTYDYFKKTRWTLI